LFLLIVNAALGSFGIPSRVDRNPAHRHPPRSGRKAEYRIRRPQATLQAKPSRSTEKAGDRLARANLDNWTI
jgi:hypothetical protein